MKRLVFFLILVLLVFVSCNNEPEQVQIEPEPEESPYVIVTYDANGGQGRMNQDSLERGLYGNLSQSTFYRDKYIFVGWNTYADGTGKYYEDGQKVLLNSDVTLYAQWMRRITVRFEGNGGTGSISSMIFDGGESKKLPENPFFRDGMAFVGWMTPDETIVEAGSMFCPTDDMTLKAAWAEGVVCYFDTNGGEGSKSAVVVAKGTPYALGGTTIKRTGYAFIGWNTKADGTGISYPEGVKVTLFEDTILYAEWIEANFLILVDTDHVCNSYGHVIPEDLAIPATIDGVRVESLMDAAFFYCTSIRTVTLPNTVELIGEKAFFGCSLLESVRISASVMSIKDKAFGRCPSLSVLYVDNPIPPALGSDIFEENETVPVIFVPAESLQAYKAAQGWSAFANNIYAQ